MFRYLCCLFAFGFHLVCAQTDPKLYDMIQAVDVKHLEADVRTLANFGTRNTFSDTVSTTRGIGASRRWIKAQFDQISAECGGCLEVFYNKGLVKAGEGDRAKQDVWVVNVVAIQRGTQFPNRYALMTGDIDSRNSDPTDPTGDSPGANDNATGMAGVIEAARVLSKHNFPSSIVYVGLSGEEQGLWGGRFLAQKAKSENWDLIAVLNNDMIGNIEGIDGVVDNRSFRIFSEADEPIAEQRVKDFKKFYAWDQDGGSRQLARYIHRVTQTYMPEMNPMMVFRLDRFGRGGHHRPFNEAGFAGVRIMETHENYNRQHQNIRTENGIQYGDVLAGINFPYCAKLTAVNVLSLASLASAPAAPQSVKIGGAVRPSTTLTWETVNDPNVTGYKIYWRETTSPQWQFSRVVGNINRFTLDGVVIDNFHFGVASVGKNGHESPVSFTSGLIARE